ncbi:MAG: hypothetical protein V3V97_00450, partial [Hyphomicrobiaceae bacterium]
MSFLLKDIDLCRPLEDITIPTDRSGLGLLLRYGRRPIAFVMLPLQPGASLSAEEIRETASRASARKLLQEKLREELSVAADDSDQKSLTVAVCTKGRPEMLARCLEALRRTRRSE